MTTITLSFWQKCVTVPAMSKHSGQPQLVWLCYYYLDRHHVSFKSYATLYRSGPTFSPRRMIDSIFVKVLQQQLPSPLHALPLAFLSAHSFSRMLATSPTPSSLPLIPRSRPATTERKSRANLFPDAAPNVDEHAV